MSARSLALRSVGCGALLLGLSSATMACDVLGPRGSRGNEPVDAASGDAAHREPTAYEAEQDARNVLAGWRDTWNDHNVPAWTEFYDKATFAASRPTKQGITPFTFDGWVADQRAREGSEPRIDIDKVEIRTWHGGREAELEAGTVEARFIRRLHTPARDRHAPWRIVMKLGSDRHLRIVREEAGVSMPGFDDAHEIVFQSPELASPVTATAEWTTRPNCKVDGGPTRCVRLVVTLSGANASGKRTIIVTDETTERPLALGPVAPAPKSARPNLFEVAWWWQGAGDAYRVVQDREGVSIEHRIFDDPVDAEDAPSSTNAASTTRSAKPTNAPAHTAADSGARSHSAEGWTVEQRVVFLSPPAISITTR